MRDVDPFRPLETGVAGDIRVVPSEERAPGDLDDLGSGVHRDLEAGVQVVGGDGLSWRHQRMLVVSGAVARYTAPVSFLNRAKEAAQAAAEQAQQAAGMAARTATDPATQEKLGQSARSALGAARRGVSTVVERIDPGVLADLIIKSTALQEMTNASLREKKSPYRISEVNITASIPPGITFAISRVDDGNLTGGEVSSEDLVEEMPVTGEAVISLDGTSLSQEQLAEVREALANEVPEDLSRLP